MELWLWETLKHDRYVRKLQAKQGVFGRHGCPRPPTGIAVSLVSRPSKHFSVSQGRMASTTHMALAVLQPVGAGEWERQTVTPATAKLEVPVDRRT